MNERGGSARRCTLQRALAGLVAGCCALGAAAQVPSAEGSDWVDAGDWTLRRLVPRDGVESLDNPPVLSWTEHPRRTPGSPYRITLRGPGGDSQRWTSDVPRWLSTTALSPGEYRWRVRATVDGRSEDSIERRFHIGAAAASACVIPASEDILGPLRERARPRTLPQGPAWENLKSSWRGARRREYGLFTRSVAAASEREPRIQDMEAVALAAAEALAWHYTGRQGLLVSARRKLLDIAGWDPEGPTAESVDDQRNRVVYLSLARGFDLLHGSLSPLERVALRDAALVRLRQYVSREIDPRGFDRLPYRSHAATSMSYALEALALLAGESADADAMFARVWDHYRTLYPVWGAQDGSDGNGIGYGWLNLMQPAQAWLVLRHATGVDFSCRAHMRRAGLQPVYFTPPVKPASGGALAGPWPPFGDGADPLGDYLFPSLADREFRIYAALAGRPLYDWYAGRARNLYPATGRDGFNPLPLGLLLLAPPEGPSPALPPPDAPDALAFEETGAVAMHSSLADPRRTSVYFLSGRFGSWNHSRAEQNAFVVTMAGEPVLVPGGYYDFSPHGRGFTRRTLASNAITFDGGRGQAEDESGQQVESMEFRGQLVASHTEGDVFHATGDARLAYRRRLASGELKPELTEAWRSVMYLRRRGLVVVYDRLSSEQPRQFEWNVHSLQRFVEDGPTIRARGGIESLCIDMHGTPSRFSQTDRFPFEPERAAARSRPAQWHARFTLERPARTAVFVAILRERCGPGPTRVEIDEATGRVRLGLRASSDGAAAESVIFEGARIERPAAR